MTDRDVMNCALTALKHMSHVYHGLSEHTGSSALLSDIATLMNEKQTMRLKVFQAMNQRGWYNPELIHPPQIEQHKQQMNQMFQQLQQRLSQATATQFHQGAPQHGQGFTGFVPTSQHQPQQPAWQTTHRS